MSFSSVAKRIVGKKIANVVTLKNVVNVAPYAGLVSKSAAKQLATDSIYSKYGGAFVGAINPQAGAVVTNVTRLAQNYVNGPQPRPSDSDAGGGGGSGDAFYDPGAVGSEMPPWAWVAIAAGGAVVLLLLVRKG